MPAQYEYAFGTSQDGRIHDDVCRQITWQPDIQSEEIGVEVRDSTVFLSGRVETRLEKIEAEHAAKAAYGVVGVVNDIQVEPKQQRSDAGIADDVVVALRCRTSFLEEVPAVEVRDGVVILQGVSRWDFQRAGAERIALAVPGVERVVNQIVVDGLRGQVRYQRPDSTPTEIYRNQHPPIEIRRPGLSLKAG